jgi:lipid II:glycine glycyltransferase (peptidoglycan interpeptide bridge formation enzyme)
MDNGAPSVLAPPSPGIRRWTSARWPGLDESPAQRQALRVVEIVDRRRWNALVLQQPDFELEQGWGWGEVQREAGWVPHRYAVFRGAACVGTLSVSRRRIPATPYSILYGSRGPLAAWDDDAACRMLVGAVRDLARHSRAVFLRVSPSPRDDRRTRAHEVLKRLQFEDLADEWTTWNAPRVTMSMNIGDDEEVLFRGLRRRIRQNIASGPRRGLRVRTSDDRGDLAAFQRLLVTMGREKKYPVRRRSRLEALWDAFVAPGDGVVVLVEYAGALVAGLLGARLGSRASLQCAAVARARENLPHGPLAYWAFIQWAKARGCASIDFGGSATHFPPRETDPGYGVYQFKAGFGSELRCSMPYHDFIFHPRLYRFVRAAERRVLPRAWRVRGWLNH